MRARSERDQRPQRRRDDRRDDLLSEFIDANADLSA